MPELREVFEITTKQMEPDVDAWREQERRQRSSTRKKKIGAFAAAAAIGIVAVVTVAILGVRGAQDTTPADRGQGTTTGPVSTAEPGTYLVDLTTGELSLLPEFRLYGDHDISPDGTLVASGEGQVGLANLDGTDPRLLAATVGRGVRGPRWSPDGRTIVYQDSGLPSEQIGNLYAVDVASGEVSQLTDLEQISSHVWYMSPSFSPDGRSILFTMPTGPCSSCTPPTGKRDDQTWNLWAIPATGGAPTLVLRDAGHGEYSPDGSMISYVRVHGPDAAFGDLWIANADGSDRRVLVSGSGELVLPRWSPDGTRIAYSDTGGVYVVDVSTGGTTRIIDTSPGSYGWPEWVDDEALLVPVS